MPGPGTLVLAAPPAAAPALPEDELLHFLCDRHHAWLKRRHELRQVTLEITARCNLACRHCYMSSVLPAPRGEMSFLDLLGLGFSLRKDFGTRVAIAITGGEPLARPHLFPILRFYRTLRAVFLLDETFAALPSRARSALRLLRRGQG